MFYSYNLSFDQASSLSYTVALTVSNRETSAASTRKNGTLVPLATSEPQNVLRKVFVGKFTGIANIQVLAITKFKFFHGAQIVSGVTSETAHATTKHIGSQSLSVISAEVVRLVLARPSHIIQAVSHLQFSKVRRLTSIALRVAYAGGPFSGEFSSEFGAPGSPQVVALGHSLARLINAVSTQAVATPSRSTGLLRASPLLMAPALNKAAHKILSMASGESGSFSRSFGKVLSWINAEISFVARRIPWRISLASSEAPHLSFGGGNQFARAFSLLSGEGVSLLRGQAVLRGMPSPNMAAVGKSPSKTSASTGSEATGLLKRPGVLRGAVDGQAILSTRQPGFIKAVAAPSFQALQTAASHLGLLYAAVSGQFTLLFTQRVVGRSFSIQRAQSSVVSISALRTLLRSISATLSQTARVARSMARSVSTITAAAQAVARSTGKLVGIGSAGFAALLTLVSHLFAGIVTSPEVAAIRASHAALKGVASQEAVAVVRRRGAFLAAISGDVAGSVHLGLTKMALLLQGQLPSLTSAVSTSLALVWHGVVSAIKGTSKSPATISPEHASAITRFGSTLGTSINAQVAALRKLTNKLTLTITPQTTSGGRGGGSVFRVAMSNVAAVFRPRGLLVKTSQNQATVNVVYYHFFVAPWAYQQTTLLPPFGGPAEPPSFGPIDPADQTIFGFDWTSRAYPNDPILSAVVTCVPPGLPFLPGSVYINGTLIEVTVSPMSEPVLPTIFSLRCTASFASGRISSFSIPVPVRTL